MESTSRLKRPAKSIIEYESDNDDLIEIQSQEDNSENEQISKSIKKSKGPARKSLITAATSTENDHPNLARISSLKSISSSSTTMKRKSSSFEKEQNENNDDDIDVDADAEYTKKPKSNGMLDNLLEGLESSQADDDELLADEIPDTAKGVDDANKKDKSEAGQIVQIKIEHFMCHQKLTVDFCKNVNFITGQNGSGKSAIVAAIQLCLGGTARTTGRGSSTGALIREGSSGPAVLTVTLRNEGDDAFEPAKYGRRIHVRRKIHARGNSEYALLGEPEPKGYNYSGSSKETRPQVPIVIVEGNSATAKEVLEKLTQQFNICVPNPCCILTQEESKKFINGQDKDKYDFFLKATGLHQTHETMNMIQSDLEAAERRSGGAVGKLADLREKVAKAKALKEEADSLLEAEGEIKRLQAKILWRHVHEEEVIVEKQKDVIATAEKSLATATAALQRAESQEVTGDMESTKTELAQVGLDLDAIGVDVEAKVKEFREKQREGNSFEKSLQEAKAYKADSDKRLVRVRKQIAELRQVALKDSEGAEREALEGIAKTTQNISNAETKQRDLRVEKESLLEQYASGQKESNIHHKRGTDLANEISRIDSDLQSMNSSQDKAAMFGQKIPAVLRQISQTRFQGPVIGPLGMHIKLKEGFEKYQVPVEKILGVKVMSSFAVTTNQDRALLHEILAREKLDTWTTIHKPAKLVKYDNVAASPAGITTILDCIIAENPLVFNTLIDVVNVETIAIVASKEDARALTKVHNGSRMFNDKEIKSAVLIDGSRSLRYQNGNEAFESVSGEYKRLLVKDFSDAIAHQRVVLQEKRNELNEIKAQHKHQESVLNELKRQSDGVEAELRKLVGNIRELNRRKQDFENSLSEAQATKTIDTSDLEAEESETVDAIASIDRQVVDVNEEYVHFKNKLHAVKGEKETVERRQQELKKTRDQLEDKLSHFVDNVQKLQREVAKHKTTVAAKQREYDVSVKDLERKTSVKDQVLQKAESETAILLPDWDGRPISARETIDKIQRELDNQKNLLERGKAKAGLSGKTLDAIRKEYEVAKKRLEDEEVKYNKLIQSINDLKTDMDMRKNKWIQTLQKNSKLVDRFFKVFCAAKGWRGGVKFEHKTKELRLVVQTDAKDNTTRHSDVRQMSGGERSYTTLCLLLALGHVIECPFRVMDEYDVFLDESTRKSTLMQLRDFALTGANKHRQFFIVTPNNLKDVLTNNEVRIKEMTAPTRRAVLTSSAHGLHQTTL